MAQIDSNRGHRILTCNCDWGCPCQFNARPTHGDCRAAGAFKIGTGQFGDTPLDGVIFAWLFAWPGAIHEGKGEGQLKWTPTRHRPSLTGSCPALVGAPGPNQTGSMEEA